MKKVLVVLFSLMLILVPAVSVNAETGLNENEQKIMNLLRSQIDLGNGKFWGVPTSYLNQAENFFLQYETTEAQANEIMGYIQKGIDKIKANSSIILASGDNSFNLKGLEYADKKELLELGQKACAVVGLNLVYDGANVVITASNDSSKLYFSNAPIIKVTGKETNYTALIISVSVVALGAVAIFVVARKRIPAV